MIFFFKNEDTIVELDAKNKTVAREKFRTLAKRKGWTISRWKLAILNENTETN